MANIPAPTPSAPEVDSTWYMRDTSDRVLSLCAYNLQREIWEPVSSIRDLNQANFEKSRVLDSSGESGSFHTWASLG